MRWMRLALAALSVSAIGCGSKKLPPVETVAPEEFLEKAVVGPQEDGTYVVATTQIVAPAGETVQFPGRPIDLALSPDGTLFAVKNRNDLVFFEAATHRIAQTLPLKEGGSSYHGIAWSQDGKTVWMTDTRSNLLTATRQDDGTFAWSGEIRLSGPKKTDNSAPGGFILDEKKGYAYVALSRNNTLGILNLATKEVETEVPVGIAPYTILTRRTKAYVTNWGGRRPVEGDVTGPTSGSRAVVDPKTGVASTGTVTIVDMLRYKPVKEIAVGLHPSGMALSPDGHRLYVANANSDTISVIDTASDTLLETFSVKPSDELPFGSAPNALAVSPDGKTLYVALAGNNCLGVLDLTQKKVIGLIPTGWYPGAVHLSADGKHLTIANTKGIGGRAVRREKGWNSHDHMGSVTFVSVPDAATLETYTTRAAENMRLPFILKAMNLKETPKRVVPVPTRPGEVSPFKHVIYIIKENRTYDQVFGDMPQGNGDPSLVHFGRDVTPNHHALVETFVLLDNFYCNGVLSADGHQWTNEGYVVDYLEKSFGGFVRSYPYEGEDTLAFASSGFIWDSVLRKGLTFRDYGEFVTAKIDPPGATWTDCYNDFKNGTNNVKIQATTQLHTLEPYLCPTAIGFPSKVQDIYRAREFIKELKDFEEKSDFPNFVIMLLPADHTAGTREAYPTPRAAVADNDLALGQIVEAVSHSKFWKETAIFVVEDDPQAGLDHVDGRRTVALCISPYTKRRFVDSTFYNQTSMLRTMELILGLPPMNQMTMAANPMLHCFTETPDLTPYKALPNNIPLDELNPPAKALKGKAKYFAELSMKLPLDDIDQADEDSLNRILWHSVRGDVPYPTVARKKEVGAAAWGAEEVEE